MRFLTTRSRDGANQFIFFMSQLERARMKCVNRLEFLRAMERIRFFFPHMSLRARENAMRQLTRNGSRTEGASCLVSGCLRGKQGTYKGCVRAERTLTQQLTGAVSERADIQIDRSECLTFLWGRSRCERTEKRRSARNGSGKD